MHTYDAPRRQPFHPIPAARAAQDPPLGPSATPIYDALYAEWVRSFKALPGDRHGEDQLGFTAFGTLTQGSSAYGGSSYLSSYSSYSAGAYSARNGGSQLGHGASTTGVWQAVARQDSTGLHHIPAALPPAPRRGL
ncbi:hypothetical protein OG585_10280 [Streptomyces sp. NBC_01340]|uniref:hypothetical protein n=1 Tax=unclassified Streptomyces TaxID=2593676 RepID=UPI002253A009|nr:MULTISPECIES: hypothetical protein [unclassified Streptomyces]MCX4453110.1 hypothetical protein [Streptomyces sp. NBC_01719]MCX4492470.1 hypothetical protein [Streptomyces sp. NBC_01728]WSI37638.1 hypothetical protein OG585_10280 [Streptomyces sp. NBC_01340]